MHARQLDLLIDAETLAQRPRRAPLARHDSSTGYARLFNRHVLQADDRLDFDFLSPDGDGRG